MELDRNINLIDLTKSINYTMNLPEKRLKFAGSTTKKAHGPANAPAIPTGSNGFGVGGFGSGVFENIERFKTFLDEFNEYDSTLIECIKEAIYAISNLDEVNKNVN